jgi:LacI family transcriptional regulator
MTPPPVLRRASLVSQTIALLERGLQEARWVGRLPGQHELCAQLMISRTTLRAALQALARRGAIELRQGRAMTIRAQPSVPLPSLQLTQVVLLLPAPLWRLRPAVARWASELRPLLLQSQLELILVEDGRHYRSRPGCYLQKLVSAHPRSAWVLFAGTFAMQQWFSTRRLPAILVGSVFPGIDLPSIEYDHAAIAQHAAGQLAVAGHTRTAILLQRTGSAADATTCDAFAAARPAGTPAPLVLEHDGSLAQIEARLRRLAGLRDRPTALFVTKTLALPTTHTVLPRLGIEIPRDLSVICREDDTFLEYLVPAVARYSSDSAAIARKLAVALARLASGQSLKITHERLMPRFVPGRSVASPPARPPPRVTA